jgi:hypothetical protein
MQRALVPAINVGPVFGYSVRQVLPLEPLKSRLLDKTTRVRIERHVYANGALCKTFSTILPADRNTWNDGEHGSIEVSPSDVPPETLSYIETHIAVEGGGGFTTVYPPSFYAVYSRGGAKPFYSDGALKFANPYVINQVQEFGTWCETYPAIAIDRTKGWSASALLINPYPLPTVVSILLSDIDKTTRFKIEPMSMQRVPLDDLIGETERYTGALFVHARNRVILFVVFHPIDDIDHVATLEHSEVYRGAMTGQAVYDKVRSRLRAISRRFDRRTIREKIEAREASRKIPVNRG